MKINRTFVKWFLILFLVVVILNIVSYFAGFWNKWGGYCALILVVILFFLIFRKHEMGFLKFLAYFIPIVIILFIAYLNFLPFGFSDTKIINVGGARDTLGVFHLEESPSLGERQKLESQTFRQVDGIIYAVYKPKVILKNASVIVSLKGDNVSFVLISSINNTKWDYDFMKMINNNEFEIEASNKNIPKDKDNCILFDGKTRLTLQNSSDKFETGPFEVYAEWKPELANNSQQIIGHYNWEIWQNEKNVQFMIGRMNNKEGQMYSIYYPINKDFFNKTHNILGIYNPYNSTQKTNESGYIKLYVDGNYVGKKEFGNETIWKDYGVQDLSLGKSLHGIAIYYKGSICNAKFAYQKIEPKETKEMNFSSYNETIKIAIVGEGQLRKIKIKVKGE